MTFFVQVGKLLINKSKKIGKKIEKKTFSLNFYQAKSSVISFSGVGRARGQKVKVLIIV